MVRLLSEEERRAALEALDGWEEVQGRNAIRKSFKFKSFNFNAMGQAINYVIVAHTVELNETADAYFSSGTASVYLLNGTQVGGGCSDADGTRMSF